MTPDVHRTRDLAGLGYRAEVTSDGIHARVTLPVDELDQLFQDAQAAQALTRFDREEFREDVAIEAAREAREDLLRDLLVHVQTMLEEETR